MTLLANLFSRELQDQGTVTVPGTRAPLLRRERKIIITVMRMCLLSVHLFKQEINTGSNRFHLNDLPQPPETFPPIPRPAGGGGGDDGGEEAADGDVEDEGVPDVDDRDAKDKPEGGPGPKEGSLGQRPGPYRRARGPPTAPDPSESGDSGGGNGKNVDKPAAYKG